MKKVNKVFSFIFLILIFLLFLSILSGKVFFKQIINLENRMKNSNADVIRVEWDRLYPYTTEINVEKPQIDKDISNDVSIVKNITQKISKFETIGNNWSNYMYKYKEISRIGYIIDSCLTDPSIGKSYTKLKNGYWVRPTNTEIKDSNALSDVLDYYYLQKYLNDNGIDFLYCYAPSKECAIDNQFPSSVVSYANTNIDKHVEALKTLNINYIDLRENLHKEGLDHYSLFYKTDHHWNVEGAIWASSVIVDRLNSLFNLNIEDVNYYGSFHSKTYENAMLGSYGQSVTRFNAKPENFDIFIPDFQDNFVLEIPDKEIYTKGSFEEIFIDYDGLNKSINEGGGYAYEQILYGNRPYVKITNLNNQNGPKILMIRDSFAIAVAPYLAYSCSELVLLDLRRKNGNFTGSVLNCIDQFKPDVVLALQSEPQALHLNKH